MKNKAFLTNCFLFLSMLLSTGIFVTSVNSQTLPKKEGIPMDLLIEYEKSPCPMGPYDGYKLTIRADGTVVSTEQKKLSSSELSDLVFGENTTKQSRQKSDTPKPKTAEINQTALQNLIAEFTKAGFWSLRNSYSKKSDGCKNLWTDLPTERISITLSGRKKSVVHYLGCQKVEGNALQRFNKLRDRILETGFQAFQ